MGWCLSCGEENPERAKFCWNCGQPLASTAASSGAVRKTVTVLFADIVSSTSRSEQTDPESTRRMLARYFDAMRAVVERHGGTVEKFIGDAVMAVFGIPTVHEDDAIRAVRAADGLRRAVDILNDEAAGTGWAPIALRIGLNTGEVVAGDPSSSQTLVTGDAVNVAARLEQAAGPGEVVIGAPTYRLVREAVEAEQVPALELKGKTDPVEAYRLLRLKELMPTRRHDTPLVDREPEQQLLSQAFERVVAERSCHLFTMLGVAGVGKSRLIHEFLQHVRSDARVLRARCLPYGEGITFWPIVELAQAAAEITPTDPVETARRKLDDLLAAADEKEAIADRVAAAIGLSDAVIATEEIFWGVRKLFEAIAADRPLVIVIDDLHWAEPTLLDLVDHVADWSREAPILLCAVARPELLDSRPQWGGGKMNATTILLEPLGEEDSERLVGNLLDDEALAHAVLSRIGETAEGNPLFVEELVAMLVDEGALRQVDGGWQAVEDLKRISVPPTVSALVAARLDRLEPSERDLIGRASVVGKIFQRAAVAELSPPDRREDLGPRLMALVRKELVRPDRSGTTGDEAFRFRHILVRDAAYGSLPKEQRADLHARFADWLERVAGERLLEYEEVIAYHLERAHRYRTELGLTDELTRTLGRKAAERLRAAGLRALGRVDAPAAENLLSRAVALLDDDRERAELLLHLADMSINAGDFARGTNRYQEVKAVAARTGDELLGLRAELEDAGWRFLVDPKANEAELLTLADRVYSLAEARGNTEGRVRAEMARAEVHLGHCRWMDDLEASERARGLLGPDDDPRIWVDVRAQIGNALRHGPVPALDAIARIEALSEEGGDSLVLIFTAGLLAMVGQFDEARARFRAVRTYLEDRGLARLVGVIALHSGSLERLAGDLEASDAAFADGVAILQSLGETGVLSTLSAMRAGVLHELGRADEAEASIRLAKESGAPDDIATQVDWRNAAAELAADDGRIAEGRRLIDEAAALVEPTDFLELRGRVFEAQALVAARAGDTDGWRAGLARAIAEYEAKGDIVTPPRLHAQLAAGPPPRTGPSGELLNRPQ